MNCVYWFDLVPSAHFWLLTEVFDDSTDTVALCMPTVCGSVTLGPTVVVVTHQLIGPIVNKWLKPIQTHCRHPQRFVEDDAQYRQNWTWGRCHFCQFCADVFLWTSPN